MTSSNQAFVFNTLRRALVECASALAPESTLQGDPDEVFNSPQAAFIKSEIVRAGRKLWERQYVDGNGGNLSYRISPDYVICTPTMVSKGDLTPGDLSLVDHENRMLCGTQPQTSEIRLHLEIYKAVPQAMAVIHCHPPYATAHAVAGVIPPGNLVPEQEVFIGPVALSSYESPGTQIFAETVLPFVKKHNTILLRNHGVVCWADTVSHAEWCVEVIDTYCKTVMLAMQLKVPLQEIPPEKIADLLAIKKKLGIPDARLRDEAEGGASRGPVLKKAFPSRPLDPEELNEFASSLTEDALEFFARTPCPPK